MWFRAVFEISSRRNGISGKELPRIAAWGFGSYETAWTWLHKLRVALVRPGREPLTQRVQIDEGFVGGTRGGKGWSSSRPKQPTGGCASPTPQTTMKRRSSISPTGMSPASRGHHRWAGELQFRQPRRTAARSDGANQGRAAGERHAAGRPLDNVIVEALAARHLPVRSAVSVCRSISTSSRSATTAEKRRGSAASPPDAGAISGMHAMTMRQLIDRNLCRAARCGAKGIGM